MRLGELAKELQKPYEKQLAWYQRAHEFLPKRIEPMLRMAEHYLFVDIDKPKAYELTSLAMDQAPTTDILFVNQDDYDYKVWRSCAVYGYH